MSKRKSKNKEWDEVMDFLYACFIEILESGLRDKSAAMVSLLRMAEAYEGAE